MHHLHQEKGRKRSKETSEGISKVTITKLDLNLNKFTTYLTLTLVFRRSPLFKELPVDANVIKSILARFKIGLS